MIHASLFDLNLIGEEDRMPNITISGTYARPIGAKPEPTVKPTTSTTSEINSKMASFLKPGSLFSYPSDMSDSHPSAPDRMYLAPTNTTLQQVSSAATGDRPVKRYRNEMQILESDLEKYIHAELSYTGFIKPKKRVALRKVIEFIAHNDYTGFLAYESAFEIAFKHGYHLFRRGLTKALYMMHYIIRFGATNFLESLVFNRRMSSDDSNIGGAFEHLIATKPLDIVIVFIKKSHHLRNVNVVKRIVAAVAKYHPDFHYLDYTIFEADLIGAHAAQFDKALKIYEARTKSDKLRYLTELLDFVSKYVPVVHISQARFMEIPFRYEEYFLSLSIELKYHIAKLTIVNGDLDNLTRIIELVPDLAVHVSKDNLFIVAVDYNKQNIVEFFLEIVPELVSLETEKSPSPLGLALEYEKLEILKVFEDFRIDFTEEIRFRGNLITPLRLAFEFKKPKTFEFLLNQFGVENVLQTLLQTYESRNEIMTRAMRPEANSDIVMIMGDRLGFDLNDQYISGKRRVMS